MFLLALIRIASGNSRVAGGAIGVTGRGIYRTSLANAFGVFISQAFNHSLHSFQSTIITLFFINLPLV